MTAPTGDRDSGPDTTGTGRIAARLRAFVGRHGGSGTAVVDRLGRRGARIVVVAADGRFTDVVVGDTDVATSICAAADVPVGSWDRDLTSRIVVSRGDRIRMARSGR